jgi:hypothetical protein
MFLLVKITAALVLRPWFGKLESVIYKNLAKIIPLTGITAFFWIFAVNKKVGGNLT